MKNILSNYLLNLEKIENNPTIFFSNNVIILIVLVLIKIGVKKI